MTLNGRITDVRVEKVGEMEVDVAFQGEGLADLLELLMMLYGVDDQMLRPPIPSGGSPSTSASPSATPSPTSPTSSPSSRSSRKRSPTRSSSSASSAASSSVKKVRLECPVPGCTKKSASKQGLSHHLSNSHSGHERSIARRRSPDPLDTAVDRVVLLEATVKPPTPAKDPDQVCRKCRPMQFFDTAPNLKIHQEVMHRS